MNVEQDFQKQLQQIESADLDSRPELIEAVLEQIESVSDDSN